MARYALVMAAVAAFLITMAAAAFLVPLLGRIHFEQPIKYINGPAWHAKKRGTPTMGGLCFIIGTVAGEYLAMLGMQRLEPQLADMGQRARVALALGAALGFAFIGLLDDGLKVSSKRNCGLRAWQKLVLQTIVTTLMLTGLYLTGGVETAMFIPALGYVELGGWYYPLTYLTVLFFVNAVNLTDGVDGLCTCVTFVVMVGFIAVCGLMNYVHLTVLPAAVAGSLLAFVLWNFYPARVFMGDTGSMFLGGLVAALAYCMGWPSLLLLLGGVYLVEGASVVVQVAWFRLSGGKRLFKMTPIHHSFELSGWSEVRITCVFSAAAAVCVLLTLVFVRASYGSAIL